MDSRGRAAFDPGSVANMGTTQALVSDVPTPAGLARLHLLAAAEPRALLLLGHGAGGGVEAPDLATLTRAAVEAAITVGLVEQPYRVAGRRSPAPAARLDEAFITVSGAARAEAAGTPLVVGGRSSGARVACRTAVTIGALGVVALAFPLHPPGRPDRSRLTELAEVAAAGLPCLVVQGERDTFGSAAELAGQAPKGVRVLTAPGGDHSLRRGLDAGQVTRWLDDLLGRAEC